jgi:beta-lactam-binding protein with PASTA domain
MGRVFFRAVFGLVLLAFFAAAAWVAFERSILGRSILVPNLVGKGTEDARKIARDAGLDFAVEENRERNDEKIPAHAVLLQNPPVGSFVKPGQTLRVIVSLGPRSLLVPDVRGLSARAAALALSRASLELGAVSVERDPSRDGGILAQVPQPETPAHAAAHVAVLVNRGVRERMFVMPDLIGRSAEHEKERLTRFGFRVGATHYEPYEGLAADTILKQYPPAGYPVSTRDAITFTAAKAEKS